MTPRISAAHTLCMDSNRTLSKDRERVSKALAGLPIGDIFAAATVSAALNATERSTVSAKSSRRRLVDKAFRLSAIESDSLPYGLLDQLTGAL